MAASVFRRFIGTPNALSWVIVCTRLRRRYRIATAHLLLHKGYETTVECRDHILSTTTVALAPNRCRASARKSGTGTMWTPDAAHRRTLLQIHNAACGAGKDGLHQHSCATRD